MGKPLVGARAARPRFLPTAAPPSSRGAGRPGEPSAESTQRHSRHSCSFPPPASLPQSCPLLSCLSFSPLPQSIHSPELSKLSPPIRSPSVPVREAVFLVFNVDIPPALPAIRGREAALGYSPHASLPRSSRWGATGKSHLPDVGDSFACFPLSLCVLYGWNPSRFSPAILSSLSCLSVSSLPQSHSLPAAGRSCPPGTLKELSQVVSSNNCRELSELSDGFVRRLFC